MPTFSTCLASVPEDDLLQKQRSIKRSKQTGGGRTPPSPHALQQGQAARTRAYGSSRCEKSKERETTDRPESGEWVVNVNDMDSGLLQYAERERVILVIGDMPSVTKNVIKSSGNYSSTLFILASSSPGNTEGDQSGNGNHPPRGPLSSILSSPPLSMPYPISQNQNSGKVEFIQLTCTPEPVAAPNLVDGYRSVITEAQKVAGKWRGSRASTTTVGTWTRSAHDLGRQDIFPDVLSTSTNETPSHKKSKSFSKSRSFSLLPSVQRNSNEDPRSRIFDAIIAYLPTSYTLEPEACVQASLRHVCATTTALGPLLGDMRCEKGAEGSPQSKHPEMVNSLKTSLLYVLPECYPIGLPNALQSYLTSGLSIKDSNSTDFQCLLLGNKTLNRNMQRQDDRQTITGLEIVISGGMKWQGRASSQVSSLNVHLTDFKYCRFVSLPKAEESDSPSTNASYSSLTNTATTDGEPGTPRSSRENDNIFDRGDIEDADSKSTESHGLSLSSYIRRKSTTPSLESVKKTPFFRKLFSSDYVR